jgi:predicted negative regulator of RcsB-dependent stress response
MSDFPSDPSKRRRWRRWWWLALTAAGLAGTTAASVWLGRAAGGWVAVFRGRPLAEQDVFIAATSLLVSIVGLLVGLLVGAAQLWQGHRAARAGQPALPMDRDQAALDRLRAHLGRQTRLPRMGDPASRGLGLRVHPAIPLPDLPPSQPVKPQRRRLLPHRRRVSAAPELDPDLPLFIDRDTGPKVAAWMREAASAGGFLVLVGDSSVGKTRLLYETARRELADFAVLAPDLGDGELVNALAQASFPLPRLVVWLDELHRFLDGPYLPPGATPVTAGTLRRLLEAPTPVVLLGSMWPEHAAQLRGTIPDSAGGRPQPRYPGAVDVLDDRRCHQLTLTTFSGAERASAARLAGHDRRLAEALADRQYNVTEALAGAPQLMRRYQQATPEQQAVLYAAIDARRLGIQAPLTYDLLQDAARGYLTRVQPDDAWFPAVLGELVRLERATAPLLEVPNPDRSAVVGYTVADYLLQHASAQRRYERLPATTWDALVAHTHNLDDVDRLAESAAARLLYRYAEPLYRRAADVGIDRAARGLADLLAEQGRDEEALTALRACAHAGDWWAADRLAGLLVDQGRVEEALTILRAAADAHHRPAAVRLTDLLVDQGRLEELRTRAHAGDQWAARRLAVLLAEQGPDEEAVTFLRAWVEAGGQRAADRLADLLVEQSHEEKALTLVRSDPSYQRAADRLTDLLVDQGLVEDAITTLRTRADAGNRWATLRLGRLLIGQGLLDEALTVLRARADAGDQWVAQWLAGLLAEHGRIEELRVRADAGDWGAAQQLALLLVNQGQFEELRARADAGDQMAAIWLAELLAKRGRVEELQARANAGDQMAARRLAGLLADQGRVEEAVTLLRGPADAGDQPAVERLAGLLADRGRVEEALVFLRARADAGDWWADDRLTRLLAEQGRVEELEAAIVAGRFLSADRLIELLTAQGRDDAAARLRRFGLRPDGMIADGDAGP